MKLTYCSFANGKCLGVLLLPGHLSPAEAATEAWRLDANPGGELLSFQLDTEDRLCPRHVGAAMESSVGRLLSGDYAMSMFEAVRLDESERD